MLPFTETQQRLCQKLCNDLGDKILNFLEDKDIHEVMINPNGELWIDSSRLGQIQAGDLKPSQSFSIVNTVAGIQGLVVSAHHPRLETELPHFYALQGQRFTGIIPPVVFSPCFTIRKRNENILVLDDYEKSKRLTPAQAETLRQLISAKKNILVCGGPGSGKTTLTNALIHEAVKFDPHQRFIILEDVPELQCKARNSVAMLTSAAIHLRDLLHAAMRMRPDRILIGEVRGAEALELLKAWNTGCPGGICTLHANSAEAAIQRLADLTMEAGLLHPPWALLQQTIDIVVAIVRRGHQKGFVEKIIAFKGREHDQFLLETLA
jgi:type IV secretion system protein TrbB